MRFLRNPFAGDVEPASPAPPAGPFARPVDLHRSISGYAPTRLVDVPAVAQAVGVGRVLVKHEAQRYGLPAFKIIGASWATYRLLSQRYAETHGTPPTATTFEELREAFAGADGLTLVTATDGNHGRGVARAARWFGLGAHIYLPAGTVPARIEAIESEGATVTVVDGDYDLAVETAAASADEHRLVVSDTSWPGYTEIPRWIAEGYSTILGEIDDQTSALGVTVDAVVVPVGVGALAEAVVNHWPIRPPAGATLLAVEPTAADCLLRSIEAGEPVTVPGPHESIMAGMNCGTLSMIAWPPMRDRLDAVIAIDDDHARDAMRRLAADGIVVGETGAAAVGALLALAEAGGPDALGLGPDSTVVCICTEGATDPANYEVIVGVAPAAVAAR